jgi:hypothetical protein
MESSMAATADPRAGTIDPARSTAVRRTTETKASFKTTEFFAFIIVVAGILISAAQVKGSGGHVDVFKSSQAWLYVAIVTFGYMVSRGLAKSGSREPYTDER